MSSRARAITDLKYYKNLTKKGNPSATPARKGVHYYSFGAVESQHRLKDEAADRGQWLDPEGNAVPVPEMVAWVKAQAPQYKYTYTAVLSLRDGEMAGQDFVEAMKKQDVFGEYRIIQHTDTDHDHAHVMMMADKTISKKEFYAWRKGVGQALEKAEGLRLKEAEAKKLIEAEQAMRQQEAKQRQEAEAQQRRAAQRNNDFGLG